MVWRQKFNNVMLLFCFINVFGNAYFASFDPPDDQRFIIIDQAIETLFLIEMMFTFLEEYLDEETYTYVTDLKKITVRYLKGKFIFDLVAWTPFQFMINESMMEHKYKRLLRLLKLLRLPRLL